MDLSATLDTVITVEYFLLGGMGIVFTGLAWVFIDGRIERRRLYERLEAGFKEVRTEFKTVRDEIKEQGESQAAIFRSHEDSCNKRAEVDARWKGRVEGKFNIEPEE